MWQSESEESVHQHVRLTYALTNAFEATKIESGRWEIDKSLVAIVVHVVLTFIDIFSVVDVKRPSSEASDDQPNS